MHVSLKRRGPLKSGCLTVSTRPPEPPCGPKCHALYSIMLQRSKQKTSELRYSTIVKRGLRNHPTGSLEGGIYDGRPWEGLATGKTVSKFVRTKTTDTPSPSTTRNTKNQNELNGIVTMIHTTCRTCHDIANEVNPQL